MTGLRMVLIGAGQVSCQLGPAWVQSGVDMLQVVSRTEASARSLGERLACPWTTKLVEARGALAEAQVVVIAVTDGLIQEIAEAIVDMVTPSCVMVHLSGATPLDAVRSPGAVVWPIRSFNAKSVQVPIHGTPTVLEASDDQAMRVAERLASAWEADVVKSSGEQRAAAHLAAVMADNYANHMIAEAQALLDDRGLPKTMLKNLILGLTQGGMHGDARKRQTGPAKRGDAATLDRHRSLLPDDMKALYDALASHISKRHNP